MRVKRRLGSVAAVMMVAGVLVGCAGPDPEPLATDSSSPFAAPDDTSTPTPAVQVPFVTEPPTSQEQAIEFAVAALDNFHELEGEIYGHPDDTSGIELLAKGGALEQVTGSAAAITELNGAGTGRFEFELDDVRSYTAPSSDGAGTTIEFGTVTLKGCLDRTELAGATSDGTPFEQVDTPRYRATIVVVFAPGSSNWLVSSRTSETDEISPC